MERTTNSAKKYIFFAALFSVLTILFFVLYQLKVITYLDLYLAVIYISYFVGLALFYNGGRLREHSKFKSGAINFIFGGLFVLLSTVGLIYGFASGLISLWFF